MCPQKGYTLIWVPEPESNEYVSNDNNDKNISNNSIHKYANDIKKKCMASLPGTQNEKKGKNTIICNRNQLERKIIIIANDQINDTR